MFHFGQKSSTSTEQGFLGSSLWGLGWQVKHINHLHLFFVVCMKYEFVVFHGECTMNINPYC
jgi:hypothetical protein